MLQVTFGINLLLLIPQYSFKNFVICLIFMGKGFGVVVESIFERLFCNFKVNSVIVVKLTELKLFFPDKLYLATNISHLKDNTSVTYFNFISVKRVIFWGNGYLFSVRKIGVVTLSLYGGFNHVTFR